MSDTNIHARQPYANLYNDGGSVTISESVIKLDTAGITQTTSRNAYAINTPTGTLIVRSGTISSRATGPSYGIYNDSGSVIIGTPEPTSSPNYGRDTAEVSSTSPDIESISTTTTPTFKTGIGIKNASGGRVEYYDGKVSGNTAAFAEEPTVTEHFYEVCTELDTNTTPNLYTARLFWMRDGQSTCGQN